MANWHTSLHRLAPSKAPSRRNERGDYPSLAARTRLRATKARPPHRRRAREQRFTARSALRSTDDYEWAAEQKKVARPIRGASARDGGHYIARLDSAAPERAPAAWAGDGRGEREEQGLLLGHCFELADELICVSD